MLVTANAADFEATNGLKNRCLLVRARGRV
jgi:hypothetical protein